MSFAFNRVPTTPLTAPPRVPPRPNMGTPVTMTSRSLLTTPKPCVGGVFPDDGPGEPWTGGSNVNS